MKNHRHSGFFAREADRPIFPINILGVQAGDVALTAAQMPTEESPVISPQAATNSRPEAIEAAKDRGGNSAEADIRAGNFRIRFFGRPWSNGKPLVDEETGYRVQFVTGCAVTKAFTAEVEAYNRVMREWRARAAGPAAMQRQP